MSQHTVPTGELRTVALADIHVQDGFNPRDRFERGELPGFRLGGRVGAPVCFRWSEVEAWLELGRRGPVVAVDRVEV